MTEDWLAGMDNPVPQPAPETNLADGWLAGMDHPLTQPAPVGMTDSWESGLGQPGTGHVQDGLGLAPGGTGTVEGAFPGAGVPTMGDIRTGIGSLSATTEAPYGYTATEDGGEQKYVGGDGRVYEPGEYLPPLE